MYENIVVGTCPNALVTALLTARAAKGSTVLVAGPHWGDLAEELPVANFDRELREQLELPNTPVEPTPGRGFMDRQGRRLLLSPTELQGPDVPPEDRERWPQFVAEMETAVSLLRTVELHAWEELTRTWRGLDRRRASKALRLPWLSLRELLGRWFRDPLLQGGLAATALVGTRLGPFDPGSAYLLLLRWSRGEMLEPEAAPMAQLRAAVEAAEIPVVEGPVACYLREGERVVGVELAGGRSITGQRVWTNREPLTVVARLGQPPIEPKVARKVEAWHQRCSAVTASGLAETDETRPSQPAVWTLADSLEEVQRAVDPCHYGRASTRAFGEWNPHTGRLLACHCSAAGDFDLAALCREFGLPDSSSSEVRSTAQRAQRHGLESGHLYGGETALWQTHRLRERLSTLAPGLRAVGASAAPGDYSGRSGAAALQRALGAR